MDEPQASPEEYVEFVRAGAQVTGSFECTACGNRHMATRYLPPCPECGGGLWERSSWSPFGAQLSELSSS
jgi:hypothetical protein